jgi:hypothetical protein
MEENLTIICEGGVHTIEYIHQHHIFPQKVLLKPLKFDDIVPYLSKQEEILVIIRGLTDFTIAEIYVLMEKLEENQEQISKITILSNLKLGEIKYDYYLYSGDLFYGEIKFVSNNETYEITPEGEPILDQGRFSKTKTHKEGMKNPIMVNFTKFNDRKTKLGLYGKDKKEDKKEIHEEYSDKIVMVDFFNLEEDTKKG